MIPAVCQACGQECEAKIEDLGIGPFEFWGAPGNDVRLVAVSSCCEDDVVDEDGREITATDVLECYAEARAEALADMARADEDVYQ